jgi:hypothetical protein
MRKHPVSEAGRVWRHVPLFRTENDDGKRKVGEVIWVILIPQHFFSESTEGLSVLINTPRQGGDDVAVTLALKAEAKGADLAPINFNVGKTEVTTMPLRRGAIAATPALVDTGGDLSRIKTADRAVEYELIHLSLRTLMANKEQVFARKAQGSTQALEPEHRLAPIRPLHDPAEHNRVLPPVLLVQEGLEDLLLPLREDSSLLLWERPYLFRPQAGGGADS